MSDPFNRGGGVEVCPECDIADCVHIRERRRRSEAATAQSTDAERIIAEAVNRFLAWELPKGFAPDGGISFHRAPFSHPPTGTNLLNAKEARAMFEHCLAGLLPQPSEDAGVVGKPLEWRKRADEEIWDDKHCGFSISFEPEDEPEYRYAAAWGEGDASHFATLDEAKAWCQSELDAWIGKHATIDQARQS